MRIVWDERKRLANLDKHGLDFADLSEAFFDEAVLARAKSGRWAAISRTGAKTVTAIFARYGAEGVSVVSLRPSSRSERHVYEQEKAKGI